MPELTVKPIPTRYAGVTFRSRTEARWAVFWDCMEVEWFYEYWLPGVAAGIWVEIKGGPPDGRARRLVAELAAAGQTVALQYGTVGRPDRSGGSDSVEVYLPDGGRTGRFAWCCCPGCGRAGLEHGGDGLAVCEGGCRAGGPHDVWRSDWKVEEAYRKARRHSFWSGGLRPLGLGWER